MADLERAFDNIWREVVIYKLHKAGLNKNFLSFFSSFLSDKYSRNLVNSHISQFLDETRPCSPDFQIFYSFQTRIWKHYLGAYSIHR